MRLQAGGFGAPETLALTCRLVPCLAGGPASALRPIAGLLIGGLPVLGIRIKIRTASRTAVRGPSIRGQARGRYDRLVLLYVPVQT